MKIKIIFLFLVVAVRLSANSDNLAVGKSVYNKGECVYAIQLTYLSMADSSGAQIFIAEKDTLKRKKIIAAISAFPFPFGVVGMHRALLGTKPWVPVFYIATFGGCFGILPLVDFVVIMRSKDVSIYENNGGVFMWVK